jgi:hypothetical protein
VHASKAVRISFFIVKENHTERLARISHRKIEKGCRFRHKCL